jgi:outer membrane biogenesis lipoprotein LolB
VSMTQSHQPKGTLPDWLRSQRYAEACVKAERECRKRSREMEAAGYTWNVDQQKYVKD